jgi:hypothetical protein
MDAIDFDFDDDDNLSTALGTETLAVRDMVPEGFDNIPRARGLPECGGYLLPGLLCANGRSIRYLALQPHANASESFHLQRNSLVQRETGLRMTQLRPWSA